MIHIEMYLPLVYIFSVHLSNEKERMYMEKVFKGIAFITKEDFHKYFNNKNEISKKEYLDYIEKNNKSTGKIILL